LIIDVCGDNICLRTNYAHVAMLVYEYIRSAKNKVDRPRRR